MFETACWDHDTNLVVSSSLSSSWTTLVAKPVIVMNLIDKPPHIIFMPTIILSGWLIAPLLFQHLLAPAEAVHHMSVLKIGLVMMFVTPVAAVSFSFINATIEALLTKSSLIS